MMMMVMMNSGVFMVVLINYKYRSKLVD